MFEQTPFQSAITLASNPEPRCPCVLLLDTSGSMAGEAIAELTRGVELFSAELSNDGLASKRVEIAVVTFGASVKLACDFVAPQRFLQPQFHAAGSTPMGEAVVRAYELLEDRKAEYRNAGIQYYRPWMFLLTDGEPTDRDTAHWKEAVRLIRESETAKRLLFFGVAVNDADQRTLDILCPPNRPSVKLRGLNFCEMFRWLSASLKSVSNSTPGTQLQLPSPNAWTTIDV